MPSVLGLLEERELAARERVEGLREEADRVLATLAEAETDWEGCVVARQRVGQVLSAPQAEPAAQVDREATPGSAACGPVEPAPEAEPAKAARAGSTVPVWRPGLPAGALAVTTSASSPFWSNTPAQAGAG